MDVVRKHRTLRIGEHELGRWRDARKKPGQPGHRPAGADASHDGIDLALHLLPNLGAGGPFMRRRIVRIVELVGIESARFLADARGEVLIILGVAFRHVRAGEHHLCAHRPQMSDFLAAHLVRDDKGQMIASPGRNERQRQPCVAGGRLDDPAAGLQLAGALGGIDHRHRDAILDGACRVLALKLCENAAGAKIEACQLDHRRITN